MSSTSRKRIVLGALIVACALCVGIAVRGELRRNAPEPEHCVLCDSGYTCRAPALLNLATGEIAELEVYALDPRLPDEVDKTRTGFMLLSYGAGVQVCMDAGRSASVILPDKQEPINYALYCRSCRALLETVGTKGYALLDLHAPETLAVYPAREGTECAINGYTAVVHRKTIAAYPGGQTEVVEVLVTGK